jgi:hypothetical protein
VFENRVLSRMFLPERDEVTRERRKLHSEELHNLCSCPNIIIRQIKSRRMRWVGNVREEMCTRSWWERPMEGDHSEDRDANQNGS